MYVVPPPENALESRASSRSEGASEQAAELALPHDATCTMLDEDTAVLVLPAPECIVPDKLTAAEQDLLIQVFEGRSDQEVAQRRGCGVEMVANELSSIYQKLGVTSRVELAWLVSTGHGPFEPRREDE